VNLHEVSIVSAWPAYAATDVHARAAKKPAQRLLLASRYLSTLGAK
jgi:hypothetical protein